VAQALLPVLRRPRNPRFKQDRRRIKYSMPQESPVKSTTHNPRSTIFSASASLAPKKKRRPVASGGGFKSLSWFSCYPPSLPLPEHTNRQHAQQQQARTILWQQFLMRKAYTQSVNGSNSSIPPYDRIWTQAERKDPKTNGRQPSRPTSRSNQDSMPRFVLRAYLELPHQGLRRFEWTTVSSLASLSSLWLFLGRSQTLLYSQRSEY